MVNDSALSRVQQEVANQEVVFEFFKTWPPEELMMACLREMDQLYVGRQFAALDLNDLEQRVLQSGFAAVQSLHQRATFEIGTPIFDQTDEIRDTARSCLVCASNIAVLNWLLRLERSGLVQLEQASDNHVRILLAGRAGVEVREQRMVESFWRTVRPEVERRLKAELGKIPRKGLNRELAKVVRPWHTHFIAYDSTPFLDSCFAQMAALQVASQPLWSFLPPNTRLGSHTFADFQMAAGALTAFALKHNYCAVTLLAKNPGSKLINLVSISADTARLEESLGDACGIAVEKAAEVLRMFMLERAEKEYEYEVNSYLPPLIETSTWQVVTPSFSCLSDPFAYMLRKLSRRFPKDWDIAMNAVEAEFRTDLYSLFEGNRYYCVPNSVKLRLGGKVLTDVDAAIYDTVSGTLGLYQLKWQLPHWGSLRERISKSKNFLTTGQSWADVITNALPQFGFGALQSSFRIPASLGRVSQVTGFVLGRFFSEFGEVDSERTDGVTWGSWAQFAAARAHSRGAEDTQFVVAHILRQLHSSSPRTQQIDETLGDLRVTWRPDMS